MKYTLALAVLLLGTVLGSCKKDEDKIETLPAEETGSCSIVLAHNWQGAANPFFIETEYINSLSQDTLNFTTLKYYISNIRLRKADGSWYVHPESYFLVNLTDPQSNSVSLNVSGIPAGDYTDLEYTFGVDSTRNVSGVQSGALSPSNGMFWSWNTGYIMSKAEGLSPNAQFGSFAFHLGGFSGPNSVVTVKQVNLSSLNTMTVSNGSSAQIGLSVDVAKMWEGCPTLSVISDLQMPGAAAKTMATAFVNGMTLGYVND